MSFPHPSPFLGGEEMGQARSVVAGNDQEGHGAGVCTGMQDVNTVGPVAAGSETRPGLLRPSGRIGRRCPSRQCRRRGRLLAVLLARPQSRGRLRRHVRPFAPGPRGQERPTPRRPLRPCRLCQALPAGQDPPRRWGRFSPRRLPRPPGGSVVVIILRSANRGLLAIFPIGKFYLHRSRFGLIISRTGS